MHGLSLIELMVAMVLGLLVLQGIIVLFSETNRVHARQNALIRLQENGRIALELIGDDLRKAGYQACGSQAPPLVFADALANHVSGAPALANAPTGWPAGTPYSLDRGVFLGGNSCDGSHCTPELMAAQGVPVAGLGDDRRVPGTDVLTVRYLDGSGWEVEPNASAPACVASARLEPMILRKLPGDDLPQQFNPQHAALVTSCSVSRVLAVAMAGNVLQPYTQGFGEPTCFANDGQLRVYDLDAQLHTATYYLELKARDEAQGRNVPVLMRRVNGVTGEVVEGIERLDLRYSVSDQAGVAYWLSAAEVNQGRSSDGVALTCAGAKPCSWGDVRAVDVSLLLNTISDLPADSTANAWDYRYTFDDEDLQSPAAIMPVTGLPSGRMLRREFRAVVALRNLGG